MPLKQIHLFITFFSLIALVGCRDTCRNVVCKNDGSCFEGECICAKWYSGETCTLLFNRSYEGTYSGDYVEASRSQHQSIDLVADQEIPNRMSTSNGFYFDFETDSTLVIPSQILIHEDEVVLISGKGHYSPSSLEFYYEPDNSTMYGDSRNPLRLTFTGNKEKQ